MIVEWLDESIQDLKALRQYIAQDNPMAADRIAKRLVEAVNLLSYHPAMGRPGRVHHTRELIVSGTPYIIPYCVKNNRIEILRVLHGTMQWPEDL